MEPFTHNDMWNNYLPRRQPKLRDAILKHFNLKTPDVQLLASNDSYAAIMARVRYYPAPEAIPGLSDLTGQADYWVKY